MERNDRTTPSSAEWPGTIDASTMMACGSCGRVIQVGDAFCRYCGKPLAKKKRVAWYYEPVWLLVLGFILIGPFAIPLVIRSPKLAPKTKWALSLAIAAYTFWGGYYLYALCTMIWTTTTQQLEQLQGL